MAAKDRLYSVEAPVSARGFTKSCLNRYLHKARPSLLTDPDEKAHLLTRDGNRITNQCCDVVMLRHHAQVLGMLATMSEQEILENYPYLEPEDFTACLNIPSEPEFALRHRHGIVDRTGAVA